MKAQTLSDCITLAIIAVDVVLATTLFYPPFGQWLYAFIPDAWLRW